MERFVWVILWGGCEEWNSTFFEIQVGNLLSYIGVQRSTVHESFLNIILIIEKKPGKVISDNHPLSLFLRGIKDTDFEMTVEI